MFFLLKVIYLMGPIILSGVLNMVYIKLPLTNFLKRPIDGGIVLKDNKRLFGSNKTWKGFIGMIVLTSFWMIFFTLLYYNYKWAKEISLIPYGTFNPIWICSFYGALWGFGYVLFELPNSFIKRRIDIQPGKNAKRIKGIIFTFIDQADSVIGCIFFMLFFYKPDILILVFLFIIGVGIHYIINVLLYLIGLKNQAR